MKLSSQVFGDLKSSDESAGKVDHEELEIITNKFDNLYQNMRIELELGFHRYQIPILEEKFATDIGIGISMI